MLLWLIPVFFCVYVVRNIKLSRNGTFNNKIDKEIVLEPEQREVVSGHDQDASSALYFFL